MNRNDETSPDSYEFHNLEEALAVNAEYLALDPEFECRKPATAKFLSSRLGIPLKGECQKNYLIPVQSGYIQDNYLHTASLDPARIYQIHYLFAGKGQALMSRWGHAMFRLVICAPHRKSVGPECMNDLSHHLTLSYRAYITDMNVSSLRGVRGKYPSQLFIMRFHEIQQEYNKYDFRDLFSVPLKLTEDQKQEFIDVTLERFWTYQGKYYFFDNNCGSEALKHLAVALEEDQGRLIRSVTPLRMYRDIISRKNELSETLIQGQKREDLIQQGIITPSMLKEFNENYALLKQEGILAAKSFKKSLKKEKASQRLNRYQTFFSSNILSDDEKKVILLRIMHHERFMSAYFAKKLPEKIFKIMRKDRMVKEEVERMGDTLKNLSLQPWQVVVSSYGVPLTGEFEKQMDIFREEQKQKMEASIEEQMSHLNSLLGYEKFSREMKEMEDIKKINTYLNQLLSNLHQPEEEQ